MKKTAFILLLLTILIGIVIDTGIAYTAFRMIADCWACKVIGNIYDAISQIAVKTVPDFQENSLIVISVCFALWIAYKTYGIFAKGAQVVGMEQSIDQEYFIDIYKRFLLATAIVGLFLLSSPRVILGNTFELALDFGSGVGRHFLHKRIDEAGRTAQIPAECREGYTAADDGAGALSEATKNNLICMVKEVDIQRREWAELGGEMFAQGAPAIAVAAAVNVGLRIATWFGVKSLAKGIGKRFEKHIKNASDRFGKQAAGKAKKLTDIQAKMLKTKDPKELRKLRNQRKNLERGLHNISDKSNNITASTKALGKMYDEMGIPGIVGNASTGVAIVFNEDLRMGLAGVALILGLIWNNLLFAFIIIEELLFMGVAIIIFPFLAACYIFDETRQYATTTLNRTFKFAVGLIFLCIVQVMCVEFNDWLLGGMLDNGAEGAAEAIAYLRAGEVDKFNDMVATPWYFLYCLFAIAVNGKLISYAPEFAGWFDGKLAESGMGKAVWNVGKSAGDAILSVHKKQADVIKTGEIIKKKDGVPTALERLGEIGRKKK